AFCNAYLVEMGLQKNHLSKEDLDEIFTETQGLPGKIPELIFAILDHAEESKKGSAAAIPQEKGIMSKLVEFDDDPKPELSGLSVEDREEALTAYKGQVPWRWQSNGVGIAIVVLFLVISYGYLVPEEQRTNSIVIIPPPRRSPGELTQEQLSILAETLAQQGLVIEQQTDPAVIEDAEQIVGISPPAAETEIIIPDNVVPVVVPEQIAQQIEEPVGLVAETEVAEPQPANDVEEAQSNEAEQETAQIEEQIADAEPVASPAPAIDNLTFVDGWLAAWQDQDLDAYFNAYHSQFVPSAPADMQSWRNERSVSINRPSDIDIEMESFEIVSESNEETTVRVQFTYQSPTYADRTVKDLVLSAENGTWGIREERNVSVEKIAITNTASNELPGTLGPIQSREGESGFQAKIRQVLSLANMTENSAQNSPYGAFLNDWLGAWKNQDVEGYFRHYHDDFSPANFDSKSDWRADRMRKIHEKRFIDIAFNDIEILDENEDTTRIRFWLSYASSFYLDRTLKEVVLTHDQTGILQERNLAVEIIPFYPYP
ncbi:MAG: hypothetical protein ACI934_002005, partial [Pseudohongiellaceae bacterium]